MQRDIVSRQDLERELREIAALAPGQVEGVFGPASLTWRINREAAIFLGAGRALLLQLAHPYVAAAIAEHSRTSADPVGRFHRTFNVTFTLVFGTMDQALRAARHLHQRHSAIQGVLPKAVGPFDAGAHYRANDVPALRWVYATLIESALIAHDFVLQRFPHTSVTPSRVVGFACSRPPLLGEGANVLGVNSHQLGGRAADSHRRDWTLLRHR
jgi:uncharacterized protein (DUF2236 family)